MGFLKLGWQAALAAIFGFAFTAWVDPGTTAGILLLFVVSAMAALVAIAAIRGLAMKIWDAPRKDDKHGAD